MAGNSDWTSAKTRWERLKWARKAANYETAKDAFEAFGWDSIDTYRSHERPPRGDSKGFNEAWAETYAKAFRVDWLWLLHGQGVPKPGRAPPPHEQAWQSMEPADRELAIRLWKAARGLT